MENPPTAGREAVSLGTVEDTLLESFFVIDELIALIGRLQSGLAEVNPIPICVPFQLRCIPTLYKFFMYPSFRNPVVSLRKTDVAGSAMTHLHPCSLESTEAVLIPPRTRRSV